MNINPKVRKLVILSLLTAIVILLGMPGSPLGFVPLGVITPTTIHIPVLIGAMATGPVGGAILGLAFGIMSLITAIVRPTLFSPAFLNPLISILPRVLFGLIAGWMYRGLMRATKGSFWSVPIVSGAATAIHTVMVMGGILLIGNWFPGMQELTLQLPGLLSGIILLNTLPEIALAILVCSAVMRALRPLLIRSQLMAPPIPKAKEKTP